MRIATYNVNGIKARLPSLLEWLEEQKPNIVCLQELKSSDETLPVADIAAAGYHGVWHGQKGFNGVAILARGELPTEIQKGLGGDPEDDHSRYIEAEVFGIRVASIYLPNGNPQPGPKFDYKLRWFDRLIARATDLMALEIPVVLAGDYNVIPTDADIANQKSMIDDALMQPESRAAFRRLSALGLTDALEAKHPKGRLWTFWDYQAGAYPKNHGFRIDHLLLSPQAADRLVSAGIDAHVRGWERPSDHVPVWCEIAP